MSSSRNDDLEVWEGEGGAVPRPPTLGPALIIGTVSQVEWSERIRRRVSDEFDRVAAAFRAVTTNQNNQRRSDTEAIIAILEDKRAEVMRSDRAGYFIHDWQEIGDQVRQMIFADARYQAIKGRRPPRRESFRQVSSDEKEEAHRMNIRPLYDRIVVKRIEEQETTRNGIIIPDSVKEKPQEGVVIAVGHGKRLEDGRLVALDVKAGDRVLFGKYSGTDTKVEGTEYIIMREDDVLGVLASAAERDKKTT